MEGEPAMSETQDPPVGEVVRLLDRVVRAKLGEIEGLLREAHAEIDELRADAKGVNGLHTACGGWLKELDLLAGKIAEEAESVSKVLGVGNKVIPLTSTEAAS
jgi:hypothetical protein